MSFALFLLRLQPELTALARDLHRWYRGDPDKAKAALRRIPSWGTLLDAAESDVDARMAILRGERHK